MKKSILVIGLAFCFVGTACNNNTGKNDQNEDLNTEQTTDPEITTSDVDLFEKEWKLVELNGKPVILDTNFPKHPHLLFEKENTVVGNLGCNGFGGNFQLGQDDAIEFSAITATEMACPNLQIEQSFLDVLNTTKNFHVKNDTLTLSDQKQDISAKLTTR